MKAEIAARIQTRINIYRQQLTRTNDDYKTIELESKIHELVSLKREIQEFME